MSKGGWFLPYYEGWEEEWDAATIADFGGPFPDHSNHLAWGVPDWHVPDDYPKGVSLRRWAWEFLRRNHDYRFSWAFRDGGSFAATPSPTWFGLFKWLDPREPEIEPEFARNEIERLRIVAPGTGKITIEKHEFMVAIDLRRPIKEQALAAQRAATVVRRRRKIRPRSQIHPQPKYHPDWLRLLDGRDAGELHKELATVIYGDRPKRANGKERKIGTEEEVEGKAWERAQELRDRDYLPLAHWKEKKKRRDG